MHSDIQVVIIDDDAEITEALTEMLELDDFCVQAFAQPEKALASLHADSPVVVLSDVRMPRLNGLDLLARLQQLDAAIPVLLMSGHGDIPMAIEAMKEGAYDFLEKPLQPEHLLSRLHHAIDKRRLVLDNRSLRQNLEARCGLEASIIGESAAIKGIRQQVLALAQANVDTVIYGDTGSGKDVVARALHQCSARRDKRFVAINCGGMSESLIESELFGHEAGSFTGASKRHIGKIEVANGGTLFLDEIESMPLSLQVKLLRVLQERSIERVGSSTPIPVSLTVLAASKDDLAQLGEEGRFRKDLYYRLSVASLSIPALRDRPEDVLPLFHHYAQQACERFARPLPELSAAQSTRLLQHDWPGNVRELKNAADRFVLGIGESAMATDEAPGGYEERMDHYERHIIREELKAAQGQLNAAAQRLNLSRKTLYRKMKKHRLDKQLFKAGEDDGS
ncbi:C4-dicarboxylate ABC transporter [Marinobacterium aestuarii]|uniref:C4-dicarboxylate ABC transporter n=1 Tax=Marinobacterium aestuarii TaxID=1821621 RepID=A0A1A9F4I7_9GAMM|nr:sigma-54 dependent transcriptional regulator [Marinobacterium aestuarii]ANG64623.1 C4-dicarboxylate ABC transporter [Marinobacterium aestuarii]